MTIQESTAIHDSPEPSDFYRGLKDIAFGSAAGMASKLLEHPFDLTKVRLQAQVLDDHKRFSGPIDCLTKTWKNEGIRGLYRGLPAPVVGAMAENASLFLCYNQLQSLIRTASDMPAGQKLSLPQLAMAAGGAGAVASFLLTPIELVKCKMQVQMLTAGAPTPGSTPAVRNLQGPFSILASVVRTNGVRGLWLGQTGTLLRESGGSAAWFTMNEFVSGLFIARHEKARGLPAHSLSKNDLKPWELGLSGACAGIAYNVSLFPADTVKSAIQTEEELRPRGAGVPRPTFLGTFLSMYKAQGIRGLYAGLGVTVARSAPSSAMIFLIYDGLNKHFG
ncbi:hypothetical protein M408DRAFT_325442 [Serendipita vermifera MAFF 305830]|uniref:Mitochondrial carrier n=1 Tax=Serendipita vermifera MAFF 305830 TaxID=933852 RepID=A0A0C2XYC7_SERVB|nr:hypothetical protein M408DRAFT_325442 [Serendipita vermifera MAFF 305830]